MNLGVNGWRLQGYRTGVGRYLLNVLRHWTPAALAGRFADVTLYTPTPFETRDAGLPDDIRSRVLPPNWRMLVWENARLAPAAPDDVLFCPSYTRPLWTRGRTVVTTFEATVHFFPQYYPWSARVFYRRLYGWSARNATLVITTSEAARRDIAEAYRVPEDRIRAVHLAPAELFKPIADDAVLADVRDRYLGISRPFFLFVGKLTARRNIPKLMEAFAEFKRRQPSDFMLLLVGLNSTNLDLASRAEQLGITDDFRHNKFVPDEDLNLLYNAAEAFVLPYSYESGFSLTAVEAQAAGTPVITVDAPGLVEVTGGAAHHIARAEVPEITEALVRMAREPSYRRELRAAGLENVRRYSWERCSHETLAVLEEAGRLPTAN